jgi:hypothetical protein
LTLSLLTTWVWVSMIMGVAPLWMALRGRWESTTRSQMMTPRGETRAPVNGGTRRVVPVQHRRWPLGQGPAVSVWPRVEDPLAAIVP